MRANHRRKCIYTIPAVLLWQIAACSNSFAQNTEPNAARQESAQSAEPANVAAVLKQLQAQIEVLNAQVNGLKMEQQAAQVETAEMRKDLILAKSQLAALENPGKSVDAMQVQPDATNAIGATGASSAPASTAERISRLEENQQMTDAKITEQSQTKVESSSKYRVRLSGIVLFNLYGSRGNVDNTDYPQLATPPTLLHTDASFGGSLRQSQLGMEAFGPTIAGARTSANVQFDFAGGFPQTPNGVSFGVMRLRTGTVRFDWQDTSIIGGQDTLFFSPLTPTSFATLAVPALAYAGNLWAWTPQVRVEHRFTVSENSKISVQGGILDSLSGDTPAPGEYRPPSWGENSGQPAYAARVAWTQKVQGQDLTVGFGGYYGRQVWGFHRNIDSWASMVDITLPLGTKFELTSQFYRGRALGGLGGGIGQSVLWNGSLINPTTEIEGLNSMGGWAQLKFKATPKLQFNGAFGQDNPYASDLREYGGNATLYGAPISKNQSGFVNFIYQPRSDIVLSLEYRKIRTYLLETNPNSVNLANFSVGYIF
jgi:hypothetical protein